MRKTGKPAGCRKERTMKRWFLFSVTLWAIVAGSLLPVQRLDEGDGGLMSSIFSILSPDVAYAQEVKLGWYDAQGSNPNGSRYHGSAVIKKVGNQYKITWTINRVKFYGSGPLSGNVLTINWRRADGGDGGVVIYKVMKNGSLVGTWSNGNATEVLFPR
jgi:hypothetical protein